MIPPYPSGATDRPDPPIPRLGATGPRIRLADPPSVLALGLAVAFASGCGGEAPALSVDGVAFTEEELLGMTPERRERLVAVTALGLAFARGEAEAVGEPLLRRREEDLLLDRFAADLVLERAGIGDDVLRAQYETDPRYELVVRHVVRLADEEASDSAHAAARRVAEEALERIEAGESMAEVAADLSEEPGAADRGGLLRPGRSDTWVPAFWRAASGLEEGEHTGVVRTPYGYHVIELVERRVVPFEEVRSEVVLRSGRMLGGAEEALDRWTDAAATTIRLDTTAIRRWVAGRLPGTGPDGASGPAAVPSDASDGPAPDSLVLARWSGPDRPEGGTYTAGDFESHVVSLAVERWRALTESSPSRVELVVEEVRSEALRHRALAEAARRGLEVAARDRDRLARDWRDQVAAWALPLGFEASLSDAAVADRALEAVATTRQNAVIARRELETRVPLLLSAYPVRGAGG